MCHSTKKRKEKKKEKLIRWMSAGFDCILCFHDSVSSGLILIRDASRFTNLQPSAS